ncbi:MAG: tol-pal system protein YbgF [candidate division KSB1 bacterium]|nr:tol-pal system protein YbgF [candidate division KSB1 bacterium]MDQ7063024.1 tol-pal system protein YbgF [candidate division KSB1 bacterium]
MSDEGDVSIDQLLGIESEQKQQEEEAARNPEEDEVLRLLGISSEEQKSDPATGQTEGADIESLRAEVQKLESELKEKERLIQDLRRDLEEKDRRLEELQQQATAMRTSKLSAPAAPSVSPTGSFRERYKAALQLYYNKKYRQAIEAFSALLAENPNHPLSDNCQYWIGESYYGLGNYEQAIAEFEKVFAYPNSNKADAALLKLGVTYLKMGDRESARAQFEQLIATYPKSEFVSMAQSYLRKLQ